MNRKGHCVASRASTRDEVSYQPGTGPASHGTNGDPSVLVPSSDGVDASTQERRRIAGTLHDGVVPQLAAASDSVAGMRSLLVDIYPPGLRAGGLAPALADSAKTGNGSQASPQLEIDPDAAASLDAAGQAAVYRVAQECLRSPSSTPVPSTSGCGCRRSMNGCAWTCLTTGWESMLTANLFPPKGFRHAADRGVSTAVGGTLSVYGSKSCGALFRMEIPRP